MKHGIKHNFTYKKNFIPIKFRVFCLKLVITALGDKKHDYEKHYTLNMITHQKSS